ncbi:MAG: ABC transporter permease [Phycisphaera sp.]|nr:MAG: ABC transporter permease [Phycisphaera sp.]
MPAILRYILRLGPTNPVAVRLVQGGSRRVRHMYIRSAYLGVMILVLLWLLIFGPSTSGGVASYGELAQAGASSFEMVAYLQIGLICVLAPVFMAGAIAQEASPRTWDILLTTPMTPGQIVSGNLLGRLFFILALLFCSMPLFALTQFYGGVPGRSIMASYLIAGCAALVVGAIAIALSCSRVVGRRAVFAFYVTVVSYLAITIGIDRSMVQAGLGAGEDGSGVTWMTAINPFLALTSLLEPTGYPRADIENPALGFVGSWMLARPVTTWCAGSIILSLVLMVASTITVRAGGLATMTAGATGVPIHKRVFKKGDSEEVHRPPRTVWNNPVAWREAAARNASFGRILARWLFIVFGIGWALGLIAFYHTTGMTADGFRLAIAMTVVGELAVTALVAINMSATAISREREDGTLDLLLTTPLTASSYMSGKLRGLIAYLIPLIAVPSATAGLAGFYSLLNGFGKVDKAFVTDRIGAGGRTFEVPIVLPEAGLVVLLVSIAFIAFCVIIGLQWSLKSKGTLGSVVGTVGVVGAIGGTVGLCGWLSSDTIPVLGATMASLTPASAVRACVYPVQSMSETVAESGLGSARIGLALGAVMASGIYAAIVFGLHKAIVRNFDFTVRKLAGVK